MLTDSRSTYIELKVHGTNVVPAHKTEHLRFAISTVNLRVVSTPPPHKTGLWNVELEYQVWKSSSNPTSSKWKRLTRFDSSAIIVSKTANHSSIRAAVDSARPGGVVIVEPGHYIEDIHIAKPLELLTNVEGGKTLIVGQLIIESSNVTVGGFQFRALNPLKSSLMVKNATFVSVQNCQFYGNKQIKFSSHHSTSTLLLQTSKNVYLFNNFFEDCSLGLAIEDCTECDIVGNRFTSCLTAFQTFSSPNVKITRNFFSRNLVAFEVDSLDCVSRMLDENILEKNSAIVKKDQVLSRTDLEVLLDHSLVPKKLLSHSEFQYPAISSKVFIYGSCSMEPGQTPLFQSPTPCVYIRSELWCILYANCVPFNFTALQ